MFLNLLNYFINFFIQKHSLTKNKIFLFKFQGAKLIQTLKKIFAEILIINHFFLKLVR